MLDLMNGCCGNSCSCLPDGEKEKEAYAPLGEIRVNGDIIAPNGELKVLARKMTSCAPMARTTWCADILQSAIPLVARDQSNTSIFNKVFKWRMLVENIERIIT